MNETTIRCQRLYDLANETRFCSGEDLHRFFEEHLGEPSPSGYREIPRAVAHEFVREQAGDWYISGGCNPRTKRSARAALREFVEPEVFGALRDLAPALVGWLQEASAYNDMSLRHMQAAVAKALLLVSKAAPGRSALLWTLWIPEEGLPQEEPLLSLSAGTDSGFVWTHLEVQGDTLAAALRVMAHPWHEVWLLEEDLREEWRGIWADTVPATEKEQLRLIDMLLSILAPAIEVGLWDWLAGCYCIPSPNGLVEYARRQQAASGLWRVQAQALTT